ncbi:Na(+)-translocating NADH-quinone reductase subunit C [Anaerohalosphaera lusitana]|uniref:Na(+)-translocating NADH-quinone reductase subunit C n=1 Tax=Anaerohalosphaera lusitana TaxID=1936003 RepID=A0A1U9NHG4_9BACT|nr:FMN-binding protein [Anaerohalosphaera lusitana]AQT67361.1 Na(+)-translocating NADH-quinone reductase subunit C [Anaerohalosphaera lusitana]
MRNIKFFFRQSWLVIVASFAFGGLLALTNAALQPRIQANLIAKFNRTAGNLLPDAKNFEVPQAFEDLEKIKTDSGDELSIQIKKAIDAEGNLVGWAFTAKGPGFADMIELVIATGPKLESIKGFGVLKSNETPGFGDQINNDFYQDQFHGAPTASLELSKIGDASKIDNTIVAITGATVTSDAVVNIFNTYLPEVKELLAENQQI